MPLYLHSPFSESTRNTFTAGASLGSEPRDGQGGSQTLGPRSLLGQGLNGAAGPVMQCRKWGEAGSPLHPWVPLPAAPLPLCLGSSCCSWAGSTSPVYRTASVPSSVRLMKIRQTPPRGSWHGGGGCTTPPAHWASCKTPPRRRSKKVQFLSLSFGLSLATLLQTFPPRSLAGTSWLSQGGPLPAPVPLPGPCRPVPLWHPQLCRQTLSSSTISFFSELGTHTLPGLCVGYASLSPAGQLGRRALLSMFCWCF